MKKLFFSWFIVFILIILLPSSKAYAVSNLSPLSDTLSTSRPSASSVVSAYQASGLDRAQFSDITSTFYLASDSAKIVNNLNAVVETVTVASMSAQSVPSANNRYVYFASTLASAHYPGEPVIVPVTAMHSIQLKATMGIPASGSISITFPNLATSDSNYTASPSASTFQLNGIATAQVKIWNVTDAAEVTGFTVAITNPTAGVGPLVKITLGASAIDPGDVLKVYLGCTGVNAAGCTTSSPKIINPTKTAASGTADTWKVTVLTRDETGATDLERGSTKIATVESVTVQAVVEPTITFTIIGMSDGANFNANSTGCASETTNAGIASTATFVNLGILPPTGNAIRLSGQYLKVSTNASGGYAITATSSGRFVDPSSGFFLPDVNVAAGGSLGLTANDTPAPAAMTGGTPAFGIFPCGTYVPVASPNWAWNAAVGSTARGSNPWNSGTNAYYATIASHQVQPSTDEYTGIRYAATINSSVPAGTYSNAFTYVATATF